MHRHTKIIATLGPAVADKPSIRALVDAGMDVARLNFSHGDHEFHRALAGWVRQAAREAGRVVAILQDVQGPKLRVGEFPSGAIRLKKGDQVHLVAGSELGERDVIPVGYDQLLTDVLPGHRVLLADGLIHLDVIGLSDSGLVAEVHTGGDLSDHKGVAFPDSVLSTESVTPKDEVDLAFGRELGVDYVAASFVRSGDDVRRVSELSGGVPVIAKIELAQAYENLDNILEPSFGVMVARGDLGVQLPLERIPLIQADILRRTNAAGRISITATEMLESMTKSPRPTRAEVTDVATAVIAGTDAVMLSGETAVGDYPAQAVAAMAEICRVVEEDTLSDRGHHPIPFVGDGNTVASAVAQAATEVAVNLGATAIVAFTESGNTARLISKYRPEGRMIAFSPNEATLRRMALFWGVFPHEFERCDYTDDEMAAASSILESEGLAASGDTVVMVAGVPPNLQASTNLLKVQVIGDHPGGFGS
ncbi:MAG TPA: pyruvate kinase [Acidimicrobiia bacterium]|nr:pyruvate kinase [Acidimicrobiia bacterium]